MHYYKFVTYGSVCDASCHFDFKLDALLRATPMIDTETYRGRHVAHAKMVEIEVGHVPP